MKPYLLLGLILSLALSLSLGATMPKDPSPPTAALKAQTDTLLFTASLNYFIETRNAAFTGKHNNTKQLDWESDGCSSSPDRPLGCDFLPGCQRHDFGYRNYKLQRRFNEMTRLKLDKNLSKDLKGACAALEVLKAKICRGMANVYYEAVREFGKDAKKVQRVVESAMVATEQELWILRKAG